MRTYYQNPPLVRIGGQQTRSLYQYTLQAQDLNELYRSSQQFEKRLREIPGLMDVNSDLLIASPEVIVDIDRDRASALGVTADQVGNALFEAFGTAQVSDIYAPTNDYWVILELLPQYQTDPRALNLIYIRSSNGKLVPLSAVTKPDRDRGSAGGEPPGPASFGDHLVQSATGRSVGRCGRPRRCRPHGKRFPPR